MRSRFGSQNWAEAPSRSSPTPGSHPRADYGIDAPAPLQAAEANEVAWLVLWKESQGGVNHLGLLIGGAGSTEFSLDADEYATLDWQGNRDLLDGSTWLPAPVTVLGPDG